MIGLGDGEWVLPAERGEGGAGLVELGGADEEGEASLGLEEAGGDGEGCGEALDGAEGDDVEAGFGIGFGISGIGIEMIMLRRIMFRRIAVVRIMAYRIMACRIVAQMFGAGGGYLHVRQRQGADYFAEECGFLVIGFDERERDVRSVEFDGESGEAGAGAEVGEMKIFHHRGHGGHGGRRERENMAGGEEGFSEVAGEDFFGIADSGEVDACVPAQEQIEVGGDVAVKSVVCRLSVVVGARCEGLEQRGDLGEVHGKSDCRRRRENLKSQSAGRVCGWPRICGDDMKGNE